MRALLLQIGAVTAINLKSIPKRFWLSLSTVVAVALVVIVLLAFLAMADGFRRTVAGSGSPDVAVVLRAGAEAELNSVVARDQVRLIEAAPGIAKNAGGKPLVSAELYLVVDGIKRSSNTKANLPLRGIGAEGAAIRDNVKIIEGRMFKSGANEVVAGKSLISEFAGFELGKTVRFGTSNWTIVGVFDAGGSVFESELWADLPVVQSLFNRNNTFQTVRARLQSPDRLDDLKSYVDNDPRLKLDVLSEADYFAEQASQTSDLIQKLGWPLAIAMALGALAGALNTMYQLGRRPLGRDRDPARHRLRRAAGLRRHAGRVADACRDWRSDRRDRHLSGVRRLHHLDPGRELHPGGVPLRAQPDPDPRRRAARFGGRPDRRSAACSARRPHADCRRPPGLMTRSRPIVVAAHGAPPIQSLARGTGARMPDRPGSSCTDTQGLGQAGQTTVGLGKVEIRSTA